MRQYAAFLGCFSVVKYWARHFLQGFLRFFEPRRVGADSLSGMGTVKGQATPWNNVQCEFQHFNVRVLHRELAPLTAHRFSRSVPYRKKVRWKFLFPAQFIETSLRHRKKARSRHDPWIPLRSIRARLACKKTPRACGVSLWRQHWGRHRRGRPPPFTPVTNGFGSRADVGLDSFVSRLGGSSVMACGSP